MDQERLTEIIKKSLRVEQFADSAEISIVLVDDKQMHDLNLRYRGIDKTTDVLSFSQVEGFPAVENEIITLGDVVISVETANRQAEERESSLQDELDLLAVHGVLHLLGFNDETEEQAERMRVEEKKILEN